MQVVILAGGMGTRIQSVAGNLPKALVPVANKPFVFHQLDLLREHGLKKILILAGYRSDMIKQALGDGSSTGFHIQIISENPDRLLGTGGALVNAIDHLDEAFMVMYGDSYLPVDYRQIIQWFQNQSRPAMMSVFHNAGQWDQSNVRVDGDRVAYYRKNAPAGSVDYIDYGLSIFRKDIIRRYQHAAMPLDMASIMYDLVDSRELAAYEVSQRFYEIGKPEGWAELDSLLKARSGS